MRLTLMPRASSRQPMEAAARPLPRLDTTPPVTKMYFADTASPLNFGFGWRTGWARSSIAEWRRVGKWLCRGQTFQPVERLDFGNDDGTQESIRMGGGAGHDGDSIRADQTADGRSDHREHPPA